MLGHPRRQAGEQTVPATRGSRRESEEMPTVARSTPHARTQRSVSTSPDSRPSSTTTSDVRHWYSVGRPAQCVFSSTHRRDVDDTANAHSSAVSCSHTTLAPVRKSCKQPSSEHTGRALYMLQYVIPPWLPYQVQRREEGTGRRRKLEAVRGGRKPWIDAELLMLLDLSLRPMSCAGVNDGKLRRLDKYYKQTRRGF